MQDQLQTPPLIVLSYNSAGTTLCMNQVSCWRATEWSNLSSKKLKHSCTVVGHAPHTCWALCKWLQNLLFLFYIYDYCFGPSSPMKRNLACENDLLAWSVSPSWRPVCINYSFCVCISTLLPLHVVWPSQEVVMQCFCVSVWVFTSLFAGLYDLAQGKQV